MAGWPGVEPREVEGGEGVIRTVSGKVGFTLAKVCRAHRSNAGALLASLGLHPGQDMVLMELMREDGIRIVALSSKLGVEPPTATRMVGRLEARGLVTRNQDREDARCSRVFLTPEGRSLEVPLKTLWEENEEYLLRGLEAEERRELCRLLSRVRANLDPSFDPEA